MTTQVSRSMIKPGGLITADEVGYQYGASGILRTVEDRLEETASAKDFGAVGNGVDDDTLAITSAIAAAGRVFLPDGDYLCSTLPDFDRIYGTGFIKTTGGNRIPSGDISSPLTINVPNDFSTINAALGYLGSRRVIGNGIATIKVADGTYPISGSIILQHIDGTKCRLVGNAANPAACIIQFTGGGFYSRGTFTWGALGSYGIDGFTIRSTHWTSHGVWNDRNYAAVSSEHGATIYVGKNVKIEKCYWGLQAKEGGNLLFEGGSTFSITECGDGGIFAFKGATIRCFATSNSGTISLCADTANFLGSGVISEYSSIVHTEGMTVQNCAVKGFVANLGGNLLCRGSTAQNNGDDGFLAEDGGVVMADNCLSVGHTNGSFYGYRSIRGSYLRALNSISRANYGGFEADYGSTLKANNATQDSCTTVGWRAARNSMIHAPNRVNTGTSPTTVDNPAINLATYTNQGGLIVA